MLADRQMPVVAALMVDAANRATEAIFGSLKLDHPVALQGFRPIVGESQQVKRLRTSIGAVSVLGLGRRWTETNEPRLGRVNRQPILAEAFRDDFHDSLGIAFVAIPNREVIRIADQVSMALKARLHLVFEPKV